ncbi:ABC transporter ATP-binding protein [Gluconobacter wancherniae]|uniref:ABC transporter ATP-binding protein n=1 Tax=Gluconobacter wancherniae TaxID=1307955 RepID=UPI0030AD95D5
MNADLLACEGVCLRRGRCGTVLDNVSVSLRAGELVGLLGLNGAGKSTLLRILLGLLKPDRGHVLLEGKPLGAYSASSVAQQLAYVPQSHTAAFPYSVRRMVELGRVPHTGLGSALRAEDHAAVDHAMARLGLQEMAERPVTQLSGGERQRVVLARALAQEAKALLLDEPMTGLDYGHQLRLMSLLGEFAAEGRLILLTSHRPEELFAPASRVLVLDNGHIVADGLPQNVVTAEHMSRLYGVSLKQVDHEGSRFFTMEK